MSEYFLGRYTEEQFDADEAKLKIEMQEKSQRRQAKKLDGSDLPFFELVMKDGTICDLVISISLLITLFQSSVTFLFLRTVKY